MFFLLLYYSLNYDLHRYQRTVFDKRIVGNLFYSITSQRSEIYIITYEYNYGFDMCVNEKVLCDSFHTARRLLFTHICLRLCDTFLGTFVRPMSTQRSDVWYLHSHSAGYPLKAYNDKIIRLKLMIYVYTYILYDSKIIL